MRARFWFVLLLLGLAMQSHAEGFRVSDIRVEGLQRITAGTVFNYLPVKPGDTVEFSRTSNIVRALYKTGFFKDVRLVKSGDVLVVIVTERPAISEISFSGNKSIDSEQLKEGLKDIGLAEGRTFDRSVLEKIEQELERQLRREADFHRHATGTQPGLDRYQRGRG